MNNINFIVNMITFVVSVFGFIVFLSAAFKVFVIDRHIKKNNSLLEQILENLKK